LLGQTLTCVNNTQNGMTDARERVAVDCISIARHEPLRLSPAVRVASVKGLVIVKGAELDHGLMVPQGFRASQTQKAPAFRNRPVEPLSVTAPRH
jgi:hypothetical protein